MTRYPVLYREHGGWRLNVFHNKAVVPNTQAKYYVHVRMLAVHKQRLAYRVAHHLVRAAGKRLLVLQADGGFWVGAVFAHGGNNVKPIVGQNLAHLARLIRKTNAEYKTYPVIAALPGEEHNLLHAAKPAVAFRLNHGRVVRQRVVFRILIKLARLLLYLAVLGGAACHRV